EMPSAARRLRLRNVFAARRLRLRYVFAARRSPSPGRFRPTDAASNKRRPPRPQEPPMIFTPYGWPEPGPRYLAPTAFLDCDHGAVRDFVERVAASEPTPVRQAVKLFYAVRDEIRYDPFAIRLEPAAFKASTVLRDGRAFCIPKAVLLAAAARVLGI